jgi:hypothetical protein
MTSVHTYVKVFLASFPLQYNKHYNFSRSVLEPHQIKDVLRFRKSLNVVRIAQCNQIILMNLKAKLINVCVDVFGLLN